jgi:4-aminobutyrate aminotransferase-like enzyme
VLAARNAGVLVGRGGYHHEVVKISPPLVIDEDELAAALNLVAEAIDTTG